MLQLMCQLPKEDLIQASSQVSAYLTLGGGRRLMTEYINDCNMPQRSQATTPDRCDCILQAKLLEHNVRFGDPECQGLMLRLESDLLEVLLAACDGKLADVKLQWSPDAALTVVMAAKGYPGSYQKGSIIQGLNKVSTAKVGSTTRET